MMARRTKSQPPRPHQARLAPFDFDVSYFPAGDVCPADMQFIDMTSGDTLAQADFLLLP